jgi:adenine/guanine phosphoribosyltransferase-like PRPP-binding protein
MAWQPIVTDRRGVLNLLEECNGYYECPKSASGKRLGPLVGYAALDQHGRQLVGDVYANFAVTEEHLEVIDNYANQFMMAYGNLINEVDTICGVPEAGRTVAQEIARRTHKRFIYLGKDVVELATSTSRKKTKTIMERFDLHIGEKIGLFDDVANNFSTTDQNIHVFHKTGALVKRLFFLYNRSPYVNTVYTSKIDGQTIPVTSLVRHMQPEYEQDDPFVAADVRAGNLVLKPKIPENWFGLLKIMKKYR